MTQISTLRENLLKTFTDSKDLASAADALVEASLPSLTLSKSEEAFSPYGTFLGGVPYLPSGQNWPLDTNGDPMLHLIQLNFAEIHTSAVTSGASSTEAKLENELPVAGLLQIFLDSVLGYGPQGVEVRFIPEPVGGFAAADGASAQPFEVLEDPDESPFSDSSLEEVMAKPAMLKAELSLYPIQLGFANEIDVLSSEIYHNISYEDGDDFQYLASGNSPIYIGGTPCFTQHSFFPNDHFHLLQFDSSDYFEMEVGHKLMIGDAGIAHLFVANATLARMCAGEPFTLRSSDEGNMDGAIWYYDCC